MNIRGTMKASREFDDFLTFFSRPSDRSRWPEWVTVQEAAFLVRVTPAIIEDWSKERRHRFHTAMARKGGDRPGSIRGPPACPAHGARTSSCHLVRRAKPEGTSRQS
jgi:hypothetical protein